MEQRCALSHRRRSPVKPILRDQICEQRNAFAVSAAKRAFEIDELRKSAGDVVEVIIVDQRESLRRSQ